MRILCIIPARSGSKGVPNKNIREVNGIPLLAYSINQALSSKYVDNMKIIVSTDSENYRNIALKYGAEAPFLRPKEISGDFSTDYECFIHSLDYLKQYEDYEPDIVLHLRPTQPLRTSQLIDDCIEKFFLVMNNYDSLRTVIPSKHSPYKMYKAKTEDEIVPLFETDGLHNKGRQLLPKTFDHNGYVDIIKASQILKRNSDISGRIYGYIMKHNDDLDIDTFEDLVRFKTIVGCKTE